MSARHKINWVAIVTDTGEDAVPAISSRRNARHETTRQPLMSKVLIRCAKRCAGAVLSIAAVAMCDAAVSSGFANPLLEPTVQYVLDVEITRDSDHSYRVPTRFVYAGRRMRVETVGIVKLVDLDLQQWLPMIPRVKTYWRPERIQRPAKDGRRWVGVEAETAKAVGTEQLLGRSVTKYMVRGTIFEERTPFEGHVWTTAENIVVQVEGKGTANGLAAPILVSPVQLVVGPVDTTLLIVPNTYGRAGPEDVGWRRYD
jgi:hypothetical protein